VSHFARLKSKARARISPQTLHAYRYALERLVRFVRTAGLTLEFLEVEDLERWVQVLQGDGLQASSIGTYLQNARMIFRALEWGGLRVGNPAATIIAPPDPTPAHARHGALTVHEYAALLEQPRRTYGITPRALRDAALLALGGSAGLRCAEIAALDLTDVTLERGTLTVRRGKGGKMRVVPISHDLEDTVLEWLSVRSTIAQPGETALIVSLRGSRLHAASTWRIYTLHARALDFPQSLAGTHTLRRTAGTHLYAATKDLHVVADILGHASINTAAIYAKLDLSTRRDALEAMERYRKTRNSVPGETPKIEAVQA
jgi:integrase/recombinase XerC